MAGKWVLCKDCGKPIWIEDEPIEAEPEDVLVPDLPKDTLLDGEPLE